MAVVDAADEAGSTDYIRRAIAAATTPTTVNGWRLTKMTCPTRLVAAAVGVDSASGTERPAIVGQRRTKDPLRVALFVKRAHAAYNKAETQAREQGDHVVAGRAAHDLAPGDQLHQLGIAQLLPFGQAKGAAGVRGDIGVHDTRHDHDDPDLRVLA